MTYEQLNDIIGWDNSKLNAAKAYADSEANAVLEMWTAANDVWKAQIESKDKEIEALKADNTRWCADYYKLKCELETAEADLKKAQQMYTDLLTGTEDAINTLKADNKRLRDESEAIKTANKRLRQFIEGEKTKLHPQSVAAKMYNKILDRTYEPPT